MTSTIPTITRIEPELSGNLPLAERKVAIDHAKAIGIILVVLGHSVSAGSMFSWAIYSFHMPFFFILSGIVMKESKLRLPWRQTAATILRTIIVPYFTFSIVSICFNELSRFGLLRRPVLNDDVWTLRDSVQTVIYGAGRNFSHLNGTLWFFPALAVTITYYHLIRRAFDRRSAVFVSFVACLVILYTRRNVPIFRQFVASFDVLPWSLDVAVCCVSFYSFGAALSDIPIDKWLQRWPFKGLSIGAALLACGIAMGVNNSTRVDLRSLIIGDELVFFPSALLGSIGLVLICGRLPSSSVLAYLAQNTIVIFPLHLLFLGRVDRLFTAICTKLSISPIEEIRWIVNTILVIVVCVPAIWVIRKRFCFAIGGRC